MNDIGKTEAPEESTSIQHLSAELRRQRWASIRHVLGYSVIFLAPMLFGIEEALGYTGLTFIAFFVVMPFTRSIFGDLDSRWESPLYSETEVKILHHLPMLAMLSYTACLVAAPEAFVRELEGDGNVAVWSLSLWTFLLFGSCVAHALIHSHSRAHRRFGQLMSGVIGYPMLYAEHVGHHVRCGVDDEPEWARREQSIYSFIVLRMAWVVDASIKHHQHARNDPRQSLRALGWQWLLKSSALDIPFALLGTVLAALMFTIVAGETGLMIYGLCAASSGIGIQAIGYLQHWGLGDSDLPAERRGNWGWEDLCRLQSWLTLGLSLHQAHHESPNKSYFRLEPVVGSPKPPAGYVILLFVALVPPLWRMWMGRVLDRWIANPEQSQSAGRGLICLKG